VKRIGDGSKRLIAQFSFQRGRMLFEYHLKRVQERALDRRIYDLGFTIDALMERERVNRKSRIVNGRGL
jgi:hypothetical protein